MQRTAAGSCFPRQPAVSGGSAGSGRFPPPPGARRRPSGPASRPGAGVGRLPAPARRQAGRQAGEGPRRAAAALQTARSQLSEGGAALAAGGACPCQAAGAAGLGDAGLSVLPGSQSRNKNPAPQTPPRFAQRRFVLFLPAVSGEGRASLQREPPTTQSGARKGELCPGSPLSPTLLLRGLPARSRSRASLAPCWKPPHSAEPLLKGGSPTPPPPHFQPGRRLRAQETSSPRSAGSSGGDTA